MRSVLALRNSMKMGMLHALSAANTSAITHGGAAAWCKTPVLCSHSSPAEAHHFQAAAASRSLRLMSQVATSAGRLRSSEAHTQAIKDPAKPPQLLETSPSGISTPARRRGSKAASDGLDPAVESSCSSTKGRGGQVKRSTQAKTAAVPKLLATKEGTVVVTPDLLHKDLPPMDSPLWSTRLWVTFSDLHVEERTLPTCLKVLRRVRDEAVARGAGVLFLGDFWETRGTLPVEPLNAVLEELSTWREAGLPMLMLVGNHDQVDLGGESHALEPLAAISRHFHVFTRPTLFRSALWLPYRREEERLRSAIAAALTHRHGELDQPDLPSTISCIFAHADVQTAKMNYRTQAKDGLPPTLFRDLPVITGHYHLPHSVPNSNILYVGSPYQVHRNEAGEDKRLLVLDAAEGWSVQQEIPLDIGPRFFKCWGRNLSPQVPPADACPTTSAFLLAEPCVSERLLMDVESSKPGDIVKWVLHSEELHDPEVLRTVEALKQKGVHVELAMAPTKQQGPRMVVSEDLAPSQVLDKYAASVGMSKAGLAEAHAALQKALEDNLASNQPHVDLELLECELEGYGPFKDTQVYPLSERGLRVITGNNLDDSGASSNGAGKSSLVTAPLWALTGDMLTRTESGVGKAGGSVDSMLNDDSKQARVVLRGTINGQNFEVERVVKRVQQRSRGAASKGKTAKLSLLLDGKDLTQADITRTQEKINNLFNCSLARSSVFFGQNDITNLLEANDAQFKELLRRVVAMDVWPKARSDYIKEWRSTVKQQISKATGQVDLLREQQADRRVQEQRMREQQQAWAAQQRERMTQLSAAISHSRQASMSLLSQLDQQEAQIRTGVASVLGLQESLDQEVSELQARIDQELAEPSPPPAAAPAGLDHAAGTRPSSPPPSLPPSAGPATSDALQQQTSSAGSEQDAVAEPPPGVPPPSALQVLREVLLAQQARLPGLQGACDKAGRQLLKQQRVLTKTESRLAHLEEGLVEWVGGLLPVGPKAEGQGTFAAAAAAAAAAEALLAPSASSTKDWLSSMAGLQPVCDKCGQQVAVDHFEHRIDDMKARIKAARKDLDKATGQQGEAQAALDAAQAKLAQQHEVVEVCRQQYEEQSLLERAAMQAERVAAEKREHAEREALAAERAVFEAKKRSQREAMAYCRCLEQQQLDAKSAIQQGMAALEALHAVRARLPADLWAQDTPPSLRRSPPRLTLQDLRPAAGTAGRPAGTMQGAVLVVQQAHGSAMDAVRALDAALAEQDHVRAELLKIQAGADPHKGPLDMLSEQILAAEQALEATAGQLADLERRHGALEEANKALGGSGVQSYVLEGVLGNLQLLTTTYMQQLANNMVLELSATKAKAASKGDVEDSMERIDKVVKYMTPHGEERVRSLLQLSGGERRRIALALCLAFADLVKQYGRLSCNVLVLDEVLQQLDQEGCTRVADLLRELPLSSVFVVGQAHSFVTEAFEKMDTVVKKGGFSTISITP